MKLINTPSKRQIRFGEVIRSIVSDSLTRNNIISEEIEFSSVRHSSYSLREGVLGDMFNWGP